MPCEKGDLLFQGAGTLAVSVPAPWDKILC